MTSKRDKIPPYTRKHLDLPVATIEAPGVMGSALGLVCPVSVYCDWVR